MTRNLLTVAPLAALLTLASGCGHWVDHATVTQAVWSDDGSKQAYVVQRYEQRQIWQVFDTVTEQRAFQYQVFTQNPDGSGRRALTALRPGRAGPDLYYSASRGYVLYGEVRDDPVHEIRKLDTAGGERTVATGRAMFGPCGAMDAVPSPDGTRLAVLEHELVAGAYAPPGAPPPDALAECQHITIRVRFYDAATLISQGTWRWEADGFMEYGWLRDGEFYVQTVDGTWRVDGARGPVPTAAPECLMPRTTSSNLSAAHVYLRPTDDPDHPVETGRDDRARAFGECDPP